MTSRLKHKLDLEQINTKSAYLNESFVQIGTPLPALAETRKDKLEYVPEWQQEVRDEQGRRRFHGAFTGGFSAGYYNSVGSKEGWAPSTFKSSRTNRANKTQRPEDFMDEEDLAQMKEDRTLENTETFRSDRIGSTKAELESGIPSALQSLIEPARTSIGQTLLQKQGWRPGQGIGPRVTLRRLRLQEAKAAGSGSGSGIRVEEDEAMEEAEGGRQLFAPRDTKLVVYEAKDEKGGLGYVRGMGRGLERAKPLTIRANHVDMDDEDDPYSVAGPSTSARPFAFTDEDDDMPIVVGGSSSVPSSTSRSALPNRNGSDIDTARWHDGRPVLNGFELDPLGVPADKWFEMPDIPPDWRPRPARVWGTVKKWDEKPDAPKVVKEVVRGIPGRPLTFEQRGQALGEAPPAPKLATPAQSAEDGKTSKAKSVFEYMSEKDRERIQAIAALARAGATAPPPLSLTDPSDTPSSAPPPPPTEVIIPPLSPRTAGAALRGFAPYGDDPAKQDRYRSYLSSHTLHTSTPHPLLLVGSIEAQNKELADFAGSARIFRPMSYAMSSRFTSGSASLAGSDMKQAKPGLHMFDAEKAAAAVEEAKKAGKAKDVEDEQRSLTPREKAAREGRYGMATRVVKDFYPIKLVCRRFGVQDPHPEGEPKAGGGGGGGGGEMADLGGSLPKNDASWEEAFIHQPSSAPSSSALQTSFSGSSSAPAPTSAAAEEGERIPKSLAEVGMAEDINQGRDTLTYTKPSIDIFKAIFASDDEDSDEEDGDGDGGMPPPPVVVRKAAVVDLGTFKPVFQVKREREDGEVAGAGAGVAVNGAGAAVAAVGGVEGKKKRKKDKSKAPRGSLSFLVDEEEEDGGGGGGAGGKNGSGRKMERKVDVPRKDVPGKGERVVKLEVEEPVMREEEVWVEKAPPPVVAVGSGRKGAADLW